MKIVASDDVRAWFERAGRYDEITRSIGRKRPEPEYLERALGIPAHLAFLIEKLAAETPGELAVGALDSLSFYSLCRGLFLPLSSMQPEKAAQLFGLAIEPPPDTAAREQLIVDFLAKDVGLSPEEKLGCVLGDPFLGSPSTFRRDSLMRLLASLEMTAWKDLMTRLVAHGDVAALYAMNRPRLREEPALTSREVLATLRLFTGETRTTKTFLLRSLVERMGKLEAYFFAKLLLRRAGFGFDYQGPLLARALAKQYGAQEESVAHAMALTDAFQVAKLLSKGGPDALKSVQLKPLVPVRPALASGGADQVARYPVWVERKYDGIRFLLHKASDARGHVLAGAYTRARNDWLEMVPGLDATIKAIPGRDFIVDGELFGTVLDLEGVRPASVYEVYAHLQGEKAAPVSVRFAAFDLLYWNGRDLTDLPLHERRKHLAALLAPAAVFPLPVPLSLSEGQLAQSKEDVNRLYHHFRAQGYEGIVTKDLDGRYRLAERDPTWLKRKPELTIDLVLLGAVLAVTEKTGAGSFGSYVIGARAPDGSFQDVGDVAGVDRLRDAELQTEILREGLMTGKRIERKSASGTRPGFELRPSIVVTVKFEGIAREAGTGKLSLRDPKLAIIRADKPASEADSVQTIEEIYLRQRVG